jgi:hypothetical protein
MLPGRTIVTADHGEAIGDYLHPLIPIKIFGHNQNIKISALVNVPWLVIEADEKDKSKLKELGEKQKITKIIKKLDFS